MWRFDVTSVDRSVSILCKACWVFCVCDFLQRVSLTELGGEVPLVTKAAEKLSTGWYSFVCGLLLHVCPWQFLVRNSRTSTPQF